MKMRALEVSVIFFVAVTLFAATESADTFKCYQCAKTDDDCQDEYSKPAADETSNCMGCTKIIYDDKKVERSCSTSAVTAKKCESKTIGTDKVTECICTSNLCNTGSQVQLPLTAAILIAIISIFYSYL